MAHVIYARPTMYDNFQLLALCHHYYSVSLLYCSSHIVLLKHMSLYPHQRMAEQEDIWDSNLIEKQTAINTVQEMGSFILVGIILCIKTIDTTS